MAGDAGRGSNGGEPGPNAGGFHGLDPESEQGCLRLVMAMVAAMLQATDLAGLLRRLVDIAVSAMRMDRGVLLLLGNDGALHARTARDARGRDVEPEPSISRGVPESVLREDRPS